jgi:septal ring factor EnvC (AmiA/AmiB activator)
MDDGNELEVLLVLCCLVVVTVFLCFSMGAVNLSTQAAAIAPIAQTAPPPPPAPALQAKKSAMETESGALEKKLEELLRKSETAKAELARLHQLLVAAAGAAGKGDEISALLKNLEGLNRQLEEQKKLLTSLVIAPDHSMEKDMRKLRDQVAALEREIEELRKRLAVKPSEPSTFSARQLLASGTTHLSNPLFVECRSGGITIHPEKTELTTSELEKRNPFSSLPSGMDGVVFLVRPDGFESFQAAYELVHKAGLKRFYEAIDAHWRLDFTR